MIHLNFTVEGAPADSAASVSGLHPFLCDICGVNAPSRLQMDAHLNGKGHKQKVENLKNPGPKISTAATSVVKTAVKKENYNIYRTPSGQFYCSICNTCSDSELTFGQHLESRKHKQKNAAKKPQKTYC